jgi:hypothetical protein
MSHWHWHLCVWRAAAVTLLRRLQCSECGALSPLCGGLGGLAGEPGATGWRLAAGGQRLHYKTYLSGACSLLASHTGGATAGTASLLLHPSQCPMRPGPAENRSSPPSEPREAPSGDRRVQHAVSSTGPGPRAVPGAEKQEIVGAGSPARGWAGGSDGVLSRADRCGAATPRRGGPGGQAGRRERGNCAILRTVRRWGRCAGLAAAARRGAPRTCAYWAGRSTSATAKRLCLLSGLQPSSLT